MKDATLAVFKNQEFFLPVVGRPVIGSVNYEMGDVFDLCRAGLWHMGSL